MYSIDEDNEIAFKLLKATLTTLEKHQIIDESDESQYEEDIEDENPPMMTPQLENKKIEFEAGTPGPLKAPLPPKKSKITASTQMLS